MRRKRYRPTDYVSCRHCHRDFRAITVWHLRYIHGYDGDHPILEYKRRFRLETATCREVRNRLSEAKETYWAKKGKHWTRRKLIAEIRKRHRAGKSLRCKKVPVRLYEAGRRLYGTWQTAVEKAGLNYEKATGIHHWNPTKVVEAIRKLADKGVPLHAKYVGEHYPTLFNAALKQFPRSWAKALRAAGFDPDDHRQRRSRWTEETAVDWVRKQMTKGGSLWARDAPRDLPVFVNYRIGKNWTDFIESFGIPYPGEKKRRGWTKAKVLQEIRVWKRNGHALNYQAVKQDYRALLYQANKYFDSWDQARAAARA